MRDNGPVNRWVPPAALALALLVAGGCASPTASSTPSQARCLSQGSRSPRADGGETFGTRPLVFLLCIQSP